jgi:hypothetical protein
MAVTGGTGTGNLIGLLLFTSKVMADINSIAKQFTDFYYSTFDRNRAELSPVYVRHISVSLILSHLTTH